MANVDGVVWAFGQRMALGLGDPDAVPDEDVQDPVLVLEPAPIPSLRVRARTSPDVLPFRS